MYEVIDHAGPGVVLLHRAVETVGGLEQLHVEAEALVDAVDEVDAVAVVEPAAVVGAVEPAELNARPLGQLAAFEYKRRILK